MAQWISNDLDANGIRLHYRRRAGSGKQLLLLHGFSDDGGCWMPIVDGLDADADITLLDARGHGRSAAPAGAYGYSEHARDVAATISGLDLDRPTLLGHSMGAITALESVRLYPNLIRAVALEDPPSWWVGKNVGAWDHAPMQQWIRNTKRFTGDELIARCRADSPHWSEAEFAAWAESKLRTSFEVIDGLQMASPDWGAALHTIACPVLLLTGDTTRGAIVSDTDARALQALIPQLQIAHIAATGHSIRRDAPQPYLRAINAFFAHV
jgi:N-formylmaleamate deformylase